MKIDKLTVEEIQVEQKFKIKQSEIWCALEEHFKKYYDAQQIQEIITTVNGDIRHTVEIEDLYVTILKKDTHNASYTNKEE